MFPELASIHDHFDSEQEDEDDEFDSSTSSCPFEIDDLTPCAPRSQCPLLTSFDTGDCLVNILNYLTFEDLNNFALVSKQCYNIRCHQYLDQTRSGTIRLDGSGVKNTVELMEKAKEKQWHKSFQGNRRHLRLLGLNHISSDIKSINGDFIRKCSPLKEVTSLDCSERQQYLRQGISSGVSSWLNRYEDYVDKGFAQGLALSLLVPNLKEIDMSLTSLTSLGVAWLAEHNPNLECIRWNQSLIWPINHHTYDILKACRNLKELHIDDARLLFTPPRRTRATLEIGDNEHNNASVSELDAEEMWASLAQSSRCIERVSCRRSKWYQNSKFRTFSQESLMRFVRSAPKLQWFRSDLTAENIAILTNERPGVVFC
ncbi:F-box domain containing protein [Nitzschia inconspicua]|uniref:F-box domain containing protein n=1 Tax=Nitzschia inconspicua TaxID=303405 RepID=A0A9K3LCL0_9STRA|nr:F-box domain containing protein [Nitzschia inconspicua]